VELDERGANHVTRVLRMQPGDEIVLFDGKGGEFQASLERTERKKTFARVGEFIEREVESPLSVILAQGISRGERMDYTIQKAVELGVTEIIPLLTERTVVQLKGERLTKRQQHWQGVAISACEQCGRNRIPLVHAPLTLASWLDQQDHGGLRLVMEPRAVGTLANNAPPQEPVVLLAGPEGGLAATEIDWAKKAGFTGIRLGPRVLRTETAAIAMLAALQALWGDFR
jgi:16S rRNA (uracil1498-N3)-methyltransferase